MGRECKYNAPPPFFFGHITLQWDPSSPTTNQTHAPFIESVKSKPLDVQESPAMLFFF